MSFWIYLIPIISLFDSKTRCICTDDEKKREKEVPQCTFSPYQEYPQNISIFKHKAENIPLVLVILMGQYNSSPGF